MNDDLKVPTLEELGVEEEKFNKLVEKMAEDAIASGSPGNKPRKATKKRWSSCTRRHIQEELSAFSGQLEMPGA